MMPRPPVWISVRIIVWPNRVNEVPVSVTLRPVTQTAEVDVNRASTKFNPLPVPVVAWGKRSRPAPAKIIARNPKTVAGPGERKTGSPWVVNFSLNMVFCLL